MQFCKSIYSNELQYLKPLLKWMSSWFLTPGSLERSHKEYDYFAYHSIGSIVGLQVAQPQAEG